MTTTPLTLSEIPTLRALAEKATPGPWGLNSGGMLEPWIMAGSLHVATIPRTSGGDWSPQNAAFIAVARDALPRACATIEAQAVTIAERDAEIARLRVENDAMRDAIATANNTWRHEFATEIDAASDKLFKRLSATSLFHPARAHVRARALVDKEPQT